MRKKAKEIDEEKADPEEEQVARVRGEKPRHLRRGRIGRRKKAVGNDK